MVNFHLLEGFVICLFVLIKKKKLGPGSLVLFNLRMLLRHVLFGELCELNQLRYDLLLVVTVGAVNQSASYCV